MSHITARSAYYVGQTLKISLDPSASPFSNDTQATFINAFAEKEEKMNDDHSNDGVYSFEATLVQNQKDKAKVLGVDGMLSFSYGPLASINGASGDARVEFAMSNIQGALDLSMIIRAVQKGRIKKNDKEIIDLKLRESVIRDIKNGLTMQQFKRIFGEYLIIGFEYSGEVLFQSTYSTKSSADKLSVAGGLSVRYNKIGLNVHGAVNGDFKEDEIEKCTNINTTYKLFPSYNDELINGKDGIIELLEDMSNPLKYNVKADGNNCKKHLASKIQKLLGGKRLDKVNAIIVDIDTIGCIQDAFSQQKEIQSAIKPFFDFSNKLFFATKEMLKGLETIDKNYNEFDPKHKPAGIEYWFNKLQNTIDLMQCLDVDLWYKYAIERKQYIHSQIDDDDGKQMENDNNEINKVFYKINPRLLRNEFDSTILNPYDDMMKSKSSQSMSKDQIIESLKRQVAEQNNELNKIQTQLDQKQNEISLLNQVIDSSSHELKQNQNEINKLKKLMGKKQLMDKKKLYDPNRKITVAIKSQCHGLFWCATDQDDYKVKCSASQIKGWEVFESIPRGGNKIALISCRGNYLQIKLDNGGCGIHARATAVKSWETFTLSVVNQSQNQYRIKCANKKFITSSKGGWILGNAKEQKMQIFEIIPL